MISFAEAGDIEKIVRLEKDNMPSPYSRAIIEGLFDNPRVKVFKAEDDGVLKGYISIEIIFDMATVNNIVVDIPFRGQGLGRELMQKSVDCARLCGARELSLEVDEHNAPAISLYTSLGFKVVAKRKRYYGESDAIVMTLQL